MSDVPFHPEPPPRDPRNSTHPDRLNPDYWFGLADFLELFEKPNHAEIRDARAYGYELLRKKRQEAYQSEFIRQVTR